MHLLALQKASDHSRWQQATQTLHSEWPYGNGSTKLRYKTRDVMRKDPVKAGICTFDQHDFVKQIQIVNIAFRIQIYRIGRNRLVCNRFGLLT